MECWSSGRSPTLQHSITPVLQLLSPLDLHIGDDDFVVRIALPDDISRQTVDFRERVERQDRGIFHADAPGLLQQSDPFFMIAGLLFFFDELIQLRIALAGPLGYARVKILIVKSIGVVCRSAGVIKRQLAAVDAVGRRHIRRVNSPFRSTAR